MSPDGLATLRHARDMLLLIQDRIDHLVTEVSINTPLIEVSAMLAGLRQEITDAINLGGISHG